MPTIKIIDPVTRIEGHMSVEVTIDNGRVVDAYCTGTLFRGFETILNGRDAWDAPVITQRICGVCPVSHATASVLALESIGAKTVPDNARILRNLTLGANFIQSHILHFYFLAARDYIKLLNAAPWAPAWDVDMRIPASDPINGHLPQAIEARRRAHEMGAIFGGRMPMAHTFIPGGFTAVPSQQSIDQYLAQLDWLINFIRTVYIPDVQAIGAVYSDYFSIGGGDKNLFAFGVFDLNAGGTQKLFCGEAALRTARRGLPPRSTSMISANPSPIPGTAIPPTTSIPHGVDGAAEPERQRLFVAQGTPLHGQALRSGAPGPDVDQRRLPAGHLRDGSSHGPRR